MANQFIGILLAAIVLWFAPHLPAAEPPLYLTPAAQVSVRLPAGNSSIDWLPYTLSGVSLSMPTTIEQIAFFIGMEAGVIEHKRRDIRVQMVDISVGVTAQLPEWSKGIGCSPFVGLSSMMVGIRDKSITFESLHVFSDVENEFGVIAGVIPYYHHQRIELKLPLYFERVLSSPDRFNDVVFAVQVGYRVGALVW